MSGQEPEPGPWRRDHGRTMLTGLVFQGFLSLLLYSASYHMLTLLPPPWAGPSHIIDQENGPTVLPTGSVMEACSQGFLFPGD